MSFSPGEIAEEFAEATVAPSARATMPFKAWRSWDRERGLARQRAKYLREVATPEGIERRRRWARETYWRRVSTPEGRREVADKARANYRRRRLAREAA